MLRQIWTPTSPWQLGKHLLRTATKCGDCFANYSFLQSTSNQPLSRHSKCSEKSNLSSYNSLAARSRAPGRLLNGPCAAIVRGQERTFTLNAMFFYTRGIQHTSQYDGHAHVPDVTKNVLVFMCNLPFTHRNYYNILSSTPFFHSGVCYILKFLKHLHRKLTSTNNLLYH